jgi:hypothetical protein
MEDLRALDRPDSAVTWELRGCWAKQRVVSLALDRRCDVPRVKGTIAHVAASGVFVQVNDREAKAKGGPITVPVAVILSVRTPHFTEPADADLSEPDRLPGQTSIYDYLPEQEGLW